jgi:hypothetical protein
MFTDELPNDVQSLMSEWQSTALLVNQVERLIKEGSKNECGEQHATNLLIGRARLKGAKVTLKMLTALLAEKGLTPSLREDEEFVAVEAEFNGEKVKNRPASLESLFDALTDGVLAILSESPRGTFPRRGYIRGI